MEDRWRIRLVRTRLNHEPQQSTLDTGMSGYLSDIEAILGNAPHQPDHRHTHRGQPWTRWTTRLIYKCFQTKVNQTNNIGQHLHLEPRCLVDVVCGENSYNADSHGPCSKCSRRERGGWRGVHGRAFHCVGFCRARIEAARVRERVVALNGVSYRSDANLYISECGLAKGGVAKLTKRM